ncbi:DEAD/DEAH box helicase family protein [Polaribacter sargassicola]|uniref:DEAD/DEAH box helicase family protein n=1 Tax=Polaribacter sargassicola TaxID=2836891 RepID=UPI001F4408D7|nr:DEAD/DEAH box helicase family protein [Polaribacter sp. DS7-9]MCG1035766.1 DEAD/DEAH box helicase family protein [Polaribacter sp. DS7-9]
MVNTTYNQILNLTHTQLATFDYIFIDECHALTSDLNFRSETIANLIFHLIEFIAQCPDAKTSIIFMSGTPNVETLIIPKIMEEYSIGDLFHQIVVTKEYTESPTINLVHLDTIDNSKRYNVVMNQIKQYLKQGRKSLCIFNYKEKMDVLHRDIQAKLGKKIKVGLFYSGSTGACTDNILSSKFGDYDVVLTTNYFINGININKDGLAEDDIKAGKTSTQKYGVVIDLGNKYSHISAIDTIQATNRFRNRLCETTVFFPKIFKPDEERSNRKFHYGHTSKTLLGINRYNFHLLSQSENIAPNQILDEEVVAKKIHGLDEFRKNPLSISLNDIKAKSIKEQNEVKVKNMTNTESRIYEDWFYSLDGYYYISKDAGFNIDIKHTELGEQLKEISEDQLELENKIIKTLIEDEKNIYAIISKLDKEYKINIQASNKVIEPTNTEVGNFSIVKVQNSICKIEGDFHSSHERAINKLFRCYFKLKYYYDYDKALEIIKNLIHSEINFTPTKRKSYLKNITSYVRACNNIGKGKNLKALNYTLGLDYLAENNLGVFKVKKTTWTSYTITNPKIVRNIKDMWAQQQFQQIKFNLNSSVQKNDWAAGLKSPKDNYKEKKIPFDNLYGSPKKTYIHKSEKDSYQKYFSNEAQIKSDDIEDLENQLNQVSKYTPLSYTKNGKLKNLESIIIPKIIESPKLLLPLEIHENEYSEPEQVSIKDVDLEVDMHIDRINTKLTTHHKKSIKTNNPYLELICNYSMNKLKNRDLAGLLEYIDQLIDSPKLVTVFDVKPMLLILKNELDKICQIFSIAFKAMEFKTYNNLMKHQVSPFKKEIFFCDEGFKFESLLQKSTSRIVNKNDIYNTLIKNSKLFIKTKKIRPRSSSGNRQTVSSTSSYIKKCYIALNEKNELICADFSKSKFCAYICKYAYKNAPFRLKNGVIPIKIENRGMYNSSSFSKGYLFKESTHKTVDNYTFKEYEVDIYDYVNYYKSL